MLGDKVRDKLQCKRGSLIKVRPKKVLARGLRITLVDRNGRHLRTSLSEKGEDLVQ